MLITPPSSKSDIDVKYRSDLTSVLKDTAEILIHNGMNPDIKLDWITNKMLEELNLYDEIPETLSELIK